MSIARSPRSNRSNISSSAFHPADRQRGLAFRARSTGPKTRGKRMKATTPVIVGAALVALGGCNKNNAQNNAASEVQANAENRAENVTAAANNEAANIMNRAENEASAVKNEGQNKAEAI